LIQNLTNLTSSNLWPVVQPHFSGIKLAKVLENNFDIADLEVVSPYIFVAEQGEAQKYAATMEQQVLKEIMTATGQGDDFDLSRVQAMQAMQASAPQQSGPPQGMPATPPASPTAKPTLRNAAPGWPSNMGGGQ
jgi:hypothetical protein